MDEWYHLPKRPSGLQAKRWERMCTHAHNLIKLGHDATEGIPPYALKHIRNSIAANTAVEKWRQFPLALDAVRDLARRRQQIKQPVVITPDRSQRIYRDDLDAWTCITSGVILGHQRTQFAAGQGGFHAGGLTRLAADETVFRTWAEQHELAHSDFLYVYDCGSHPSRHVEAEISHFLRKCSRRRLDMLFISHFDADHVSGVPTLVRSDKLEVDTIVLPYVDDLEKVIAFARVADRAEPPQEFFKDLVVDTIGTLKDIGVGWILQIDNGDGPSPDTPLSDPIGGGPEGLRWKIAPFGDERSEIRSTGRDSLYVRNCAIDVSVAADEGLKIAWRFLPYVQRLDEDAKTLFAQIAETLLGWEDGSFHARIQEKDERRKLVTDETDALGEAYLNAFGDRNATSLSLYSGPADPSRVGATVIRPRLKPWPQAKMGWLGTGDAPLRAGAKVKAFEAHYGELLDSVSTFMLPHHGSIHNSNPKRLIADPDIYVAAAETIRDDWKHPAPQLRKAVKKAGKRFVQVGSAQRSRLKEAAILFYPTE